MNQFVKRLMVTGLGLFFFALLLLALPAFASHPEAGIASGASHGQSKKGSSLAVDLFRNNCARCHGADGRGDTPLGHTYNTPDFTDAEWWRKHSNITSNASLISIVTHGKGGMPAFGKKLTRTQIRLLVSHVRKFKP